MTPRQYALAAQGYHFRFDRKEEGLRRLWLLLFNINSKKGKGITSLTQLREYWPLKTDDAAEDKPLTLEEAKAKFASALEQTVKQNDRRIKG